MNVQRFAYAALMMGGMALSFGKWLVFSAVLSPIEFGVYTTLITTTAFLAYFGAFGLNEHIIAGGSALGAHDRPRIYQLRDKVLTVGAANAAVLIVLGMLFWWGVDIKRPDYMEFALVGALLVTTVVFNIVDASLRAALRLMPFAFMVFARAALLLVVGYLTVDRFGLSGLLLSEVLAGWIAIAYAIFVAGPRSSVSSLKISAAEISRHLRIGSTFLGLQVLRYFSFVVDKWLVGWFLGPLALGLYSFFTITFLALTAFAGIYNAAVTPRIISLFGRNADVEDLYNTTSKQAYFFVGFAAITTPIYVFGAEAIVLRFFSQYATGDLKLCFALIYVGSALHVAVHFFDSFFYSLSKQSDMLLTAVLGLLVFVALFTLAGSYSPAVTSFCAAFLIAKLALLAMTFSRVRAAVSPDTSTT